MKGYDPDGNLGPRKPLPDSVAIQEPALDKPILLPSSEQKEPFLPVAAVAEETQYQPDQFPQQQQEPYTEPGAF